MKAFRKISAGAAFILLLGSTTAIAQTAPAPQWPTITQEAKPWTRWWWMGSAVNEKDLSYLMEQYQKAGLGGVEITPIYGVKGTESEFIDFLSPKWMEMLKHTLREGERLNMGVDMAQASGWPFGGPWVSQEDACKYVAHKTYSLKSGESLKEPVQFSQQPLVRTVGEKIAIEKLQEPIIKNPNLQLHAFDQVRFPKPLPLQTLMAYSDKGQVLDLTNKVDQKGTLSWKAPAGNWNLYAIFQGWHGKMVERAGPGGEGDVIDHFSKQATENYLKRFDEAFKGQDIKSLRAFFNDSYEVDDAQGEANWTPRLLEEFQKRRGYDLRHHLPALFGKSTLENNQRVRCDYRETISDLILENYTQEWHTWAQKHGALIRNQAHGSPANILDLYAATDIPEIEGTDIMRIKFASSAANVTGKKLSSSESATWENEHFLSSLRDVKKAMDLFLLGGVNHTFYHGTNYSPQAAAWPGWLFYAAVHFNPSNTFWNDFAALNNYVARSQSFLQAGKPNNDVLLYLPIYDTYSTPGNALLQHFDGIAHGFRGTGVEASANEMQAKGYSFDFISDRQLLQVKSAQNTLQTGGIAYKTVVVPDARLIPLETFEQLVKLAREGATVVVYKNLPADVPGLGSLKERQAKYQQLVAQLNFSNTDKAGIRKATIGKGSFVAGSDLHEALQFAGLKREPMVDSGLQYVRRQHDQGNYYFISNWGEKAFDGYVPLQANSLSVAVFDPMTGKTGYSNIRKSGDGTNEVYLQLAPGESCILETRTTTASGTPYTYTKPAGNAQELSGNWTIRFTEGGPAKPAEVKTSTLKSWADFGAEEYKNFSGTASYTLSFTKPKGKAQAWLLDLGQVEESARVLLNGKELETLIGPTYQLTIPDNLLRKKNVLEVQVSNSMANRAAYMDRNKIAWKKFYNVNVAARRSENRDDQGGFTAAKWQPRASGLIGPVLLTPITLEAGAGAEATVQSKK
ncbi:glycoside hydrolase family 2 protein [Pontibacter qinzhouensis]|uniref:Glycoside hydrolase family 2 protein n=1 Tax=Pontibacter qinzhouensis TaxID=2603253 RepID=A0A5C8KA19_9BACT|nr:glycosyl hydrolase [Pontibacter qinzhouensis]TXK48907.1 glycoside hydrolase family 2 protein [Pontibacter qinzhouensis]